MASKGDEDDINSPVPKHLVSNELGPKPLLSHEPSIQQEHSSGSTPTIGPLLPTEPGVTPVSSASNEEKALPLVSREPIEDEYHGFIDINPDAGFSTLHQHHDQSESPIFGRSADLEASNFQLVEEIQRNPPRPLQQRIESIEAKLYLQDTLHRMSKHDLQATKEKIKELEVIERVNIAEMGAFKIGASDKMSSLEDKLDVLTMKIDEHIEEADKKEKERVILVAENEELRGLVNELIERAERERRELPDVIVKLEQKLKEVTDKLIDREKDMQATSDELQESRNDAKRLRKKSESLEVEKGFLGVQLKERDATIRERDVTIIEQELLLENQKRFLERFEKRCKELEETNKRLKNEDGYYKETKFKVRPCSTAVNFISSLGQAATPHPSVNRDIGLECFSCGSGYLPSDHETNNCKFHPLPGMHYREWKLWPVGDGVRQSDMEKLYWACCNKLTYGRPEGCCSGRHHQQWEMDITMKTVLLSKDNLDWFQ